MAHDGMFPYCLMISMINERAWSYCVQGANGLGEVHMGLKILRPNEFLIFLLD